MDPHLILSKAFEGATINEQKAVIVTYGHSEQQNSSRIGRYFVVALQNIKLINSIRRALKSNLDTHVLIREFSSVCLLVLAVFIFPLRARMVFNINHNLKNVEDRFPLILYILAKIGFNFLMLDGYYLEQYIPASIKQNILIHPFPCHRSLRSRTYKIDPHILINIGVVGDFRAEKGSLSEITGAVKELALLNSCNICIGARNPSAVQLYFKDMDIQIANTGSHEQYHAYLNSLDILLIFAKRETYFRRHSGTIMDGISHGVITLAPNFPVFKSQLEVPVTIGITYQSSAEIKATAVLAIQQINCLRNNLVKYISHRVAPLNLHTKHV
jgi:hypothetical protein